MNDTTDALPQQGSDQPEPEHSGESVTSYDLLRERLAGAAARLAANATTLNQQRAAVFAPLPMSLVEQDRVHTDAACLPRDAASIGSMLLLGYNIPPGLATNRAVTDVFALYNLQRTSPTNWDVLPVAPNDPAWFLGDAAFQRDFGEIYRYYADARLISLGVAGDELRMTFGIGSADSDVRTLRWRMPRAETQDLPKYVDAYGVDAGHGEATFDFAWTPIGREALGGGRWPHLNVLDTVFIGATKGQLDFRIDDPFYSLTEGGLSISTDRVSEAEADIAEHRVAAARIGDLLLLRIQPYREDTERYYAYSRLSRRLERIDAIGRGCRMLPEDQGIVFPGGYLLSSGESRVFSTDAATSRLIESHRSPNGEDVLYVYRRPDTGGESLCAYNLVRREMAIPVPAIGYALFPDGTIVCVRDSGEAQRVHTVAIYASPFCLPERYEPNVSTDSVFGKVGNSEMVSGLSEAIALSSEARSTAQAGDTTINRSVYEALIARTTRLLDRHAWIADSEADGLQAGLVELRKAAGDVLDELANVAAGQRQAKAQVELARTDAADYLASTELALRDADAFIDTLAKARDLLGRLTTLSEVRYVDLTAVDDIRQRIEMSYEVVGSKTVDFLSQRNALDGLRHGVDEAGQAGRTATTASAIAEQNRVLDELGQRLGFLTEIVGSLDVADVTQRTALLGQLSDLLASRNGVRAELDARTRQLRSTENDAAFAASLAVVGQRLQSSLLLADSPALCDAAISDLLAEIENASMAFGDVEAFATALELKRSEVIDSLSRRRDDLLRAQATRIDRLTEGAQRTITTLNERAAGLPDRPAVDTLFSTDPLVARVRSALKELRLLGSEGKASELEVAFIGARDTARRTVTDRAELFGDGYVRLGRHRIGVNEGRFDLRLTATPTAAGMVSVVRLTGTDLTLALPPIEASTIVERHPHWVEQTYAIETPNIGRALGLALSAIDARLEMQGTSRETCVALLRSFASGNPQFGAEPGVHDEDAARFVEVLLPVVTGPLSLRVTGKMRAAAVLLRKTWSDQHGEMLNPRLAAISDLAEAATRTIDSIIDQCSKDFLDVFESLDVPEDERSETGRMVVRLLAEPTSVSLSTSAQLGYDEVTRWASGIRLDLSQLSLRDLHACVTDLLFGQRTTAEAGIDVVDDSDVADVVAETCALLVEPQTPVAALPSVIAVDGLRSRGPGIIDGRASIDIARTLSEWREHQRTGAERFAQFDVARQSVLSHLREEIGIDQLRPRVINGFVRNRLVDDVLLPLVGDAFAKQLGMVGPAQGLLLLISPPGYGKTTLLEYVADLLGFAMVKLNGPAIGSTVTSLDPTQADDAAAAAELVKLNRAFAMSTNTILLVDDIQHLHPEFLQKFIPLSDATRRIEGVIDGRAQTFDLRNKRFVVAMAGNPYTSTGAAFRLPDMLANRADVHNLGDLVGTTTMAAAFAQSYLENACGANETLRPLLSEGRRGIEALVTAASAGDVVQADQLRRQWSSAELGPVLKTLRHLVQVRDVLLKVNAAYIRSAQMTDAMRGEPAFQLQGSYRNMTRIAQRIVPVMTFAEVDDIIVDHYRTESQALAGNAAWNMAKWEVVVGRMDDNYLTEFKDRWRQARLSEDPAASLVSALRSIESALRQETFDGP